MNKELLNADNRRSNHFKKMVNKVWTVSKIPFYHMHVNGSVVHAYMMVENKKMNWQKSNRKNLIFTLKYAEKIDNLCL